MRVVYVEDNIANVHLVKRVARMGKHEIINYIDGMDALNNFSNDEPDLVLMDIQLAGELTGIEVVQKLRDKGYTTPIIAVTAYAMVGDKERCMEAGCTGYMSKPIPIPDLVNLFQKYDKPKAEPATEPQIEDNTTATTVDSPLVEKKTTPTTETSKSAETEEATADTTSTQEAPEISTSQVAEIKVQQDESSTSATATSDISEEKDKTQASKKEVTDTTSKSDAEGQDKLAVEDSKPVESPTTDLKSSPEAKMT